MKALRVLNLRRPALRAQAESSTGRRNVKSGKLVRMILQRLEHCSVTHVADSIIFFSTVEMLPGDFARSGFRSHLADRQ